MHFAFLFWGEDDFESEGVLVALLELFVFHTDTLPLDFIRSGY